MTQRSSRIVKRAMLCGLGTIILCCCIFILGITPTNASSPNIFQTITAEQAIDIMKGEGYAVNLDDDGDIIWKIDGWRTIMVIGKGGQYMQHYAAFVDNDATLDEVNEWNRTKQFSRAYIDSEGDPVLELDLDLAGGVTRERIVDFLKTCLISFKAWYDEVVE